MAGLLSGARDRLRWLGHRISATPFYNETLPALRHKSVLLGRLMRLDRPIGTYLLLWPMLWALWLSSDGKPMPDMLIVFSVGVFLTRSAGCVANDFVDADIDPHVQRTRERPLAQRVVTRREAIALFLTLSLLSLSLLYFLNTLARQLALVAGVLLVTYPFFKRFFPLPQAYLGIAFTWSVPMVYAAQTGTVPQVAWLVFIAGLLWTVAYDTMYAMVDREDDLRLGLRSSAILFGDADRTIVAALQAMTLLAMGLVGRTLELGSWFAGGLVAASLFAAYEQWLIRDRDRGRCLQAFLNNNYFGLSIFAGIALDYLFRSPPA
jgi:4-hydroxybenzoate polyprenyltransferase